MYQNEEYFTEVDGRRSNFLQTRRNKYVRVMVKSMKGLLALERRREWQDMFLKLYKENSKEGREPKSF